MTHHVPILPPTPEQIATERRWADRKLQLVLGALLAFTALCTLEFLAGPAAVFAVALLVLGAFVVRRARP